MGRNKSKDDLIDRVKWLTDKVKWLEEQIYANTEDAWCGVRPTLNGKVEAILEHLKLEVNVEPQQVKISKIKAKKGKK